MASSHSPENLYYRIGEAARMLNVSASSLRNWERMGLLQPARSQGKYRLYSRDTIEKIRKVKYLRRVKRVNPAGIAEMLRDENGAASKLGEPIRKQETICHRLIKLRRQLGHTLAEVARSTGVSVSFLSALERGHANASIATLQKLAKLYKTNVLSFFSENSRSSRLVKARDRRVLKPNRGVRMELLASGERAMEPHLFRISAGSTSGGSYSHEGEEFIFVLQGKLELWLDEVERYVLEAGDSLYFESNHAHRWASLSQGETLLLWVNTPATF